MNLLIFNCGSSSQAFKVYSAEGQTLAWGKARNVAAQTQANAAIDWHIRGGSGSMQTVLASHRQAAENILALLDEQQVKIDAIGHRFVHGGPLFDRSARIDPATLEKLQACLHFAPIHNPNSFSVIQLCRERLPNLPQFVVFDTAFHAGLPAASRQYALPRDLAAKHGYRKYGFHGLSLQYVSTRAAGLMNRPLDSLKLILCHLGTGGSSVTAFKDGRSLDTSMGYSPLPGLVMSTRCGDLDPEIVLDLLREGRTPGQVSDLLNNRSGLIGLSGYSSNLEEVIAAAESGDPACQLAYEVYAQRLKTYLGAYTWLLNGADAIVFTDQIGLTCWKLREKVCAGAQNLGVELNPQKNRLALGQEPALVSSPASRTQIWVIPTDEEIVILREVLALL